MFVLKSSQMVPFLGNVSLGMFHFAWSLIWE
jgi:hypothetical protein